MGKPPFFFIIILVIIAMLAAHHYLQKRKQDEINAASPVRSLVVDVVAKRDYPSPNLHSRQRRVVPMETRHYEIDFFVALTGETLTITVPEEDYQQITQGSKGTLQLQGSEFISFTPVQQ